MSLSTSQVFNAWRLTLTILSQDRNGTILLPWLKKHRVSAGSKCFQLVRNAQCHTNSTCSTSFLRLRFPLIHYLSIASSLTSSRCSVRRREEVSIKARWQQTLLVDSLHQGKRWKSSRSTKVSSWSQKFSSIIAFTSLQKRTWWTTQPRNWAKFTSVALSSFASTPSLTRE